MLWIYCQLLESAFDTFIHFDIKDIFLRHTNVICVYCLNNKFYIRRICSRFYLKKNPQSLNFMTCGIQLEKWSQNSPEHMSPKSKHLKGQLEPPVLEVTFLHHRRFVTSPCWLRTPQNCILACSSNLGLAGRRPALA